VAVAGVQNATTDLVLDDEALAKHAEVDALSVTMGIVIATPAPDRPTLEWSTWARLGFGVASTPVHRRARHHPADGRIVIHLEAAVTADLSMAVAHHCDLRLGASAELRTSSGPVGGELVVEGFLRIPIGDFDGTGGVLLRAEGNTHVVTAALAFGYVGSWSRSDPWISFARHVVGVRLVVSMNRSDG
jgi:hypothetical protein